MTDLIQPSFSKGEVDPAITGRVDTRLYKLGLKTARNTVIHQFGGLSNRPGTTFLNYAQSGASLPRLVPFKFRTTDTHILEFGNEYIRVYRNDGLVTDDNANITNITEADPAVITITGYTSANDGQYVYISGVGGMTEVNGKVYRIDHVAGSTFNLYDPQLQDNVDASAFGTYTSGGTTDRIHTVTTPYQQADLRELKFAQTGDVITITHPDYAPKELQRSALDSWALADVSFNPEISAPTTLATTGSTAAATYQYKVTAIATDTEEESLAATWESANDTISAITKANPCVITAGSAGWVAGSELLLTGISGMTELNNRRFIISSVSGNDVTIPVDSTNYTTYTSGGTMTPCFINVTTDTTTLSWAAVSSASRYRIFRKLNGTFGYIGTAYGLSFTDPGVSALTADVSDTPPLYQEPFYGADNYPGAVGLYQQRRVFGGSNNNPDTSYFSGINAYTNFTHSVPFKDTDGFSATLAGNLISPIRHYIPLRDLLIFTSENEWKVNSGSSGNRFSADTILQSPTTNWGSSHLPPIPVSNTVLYYQDVGLSVRGTKYTFESDNYESTALSLLSRHMFDGHELLEWGLVKTPDPVVYMVRDDGQLLALTYNEEQEVVAWSRMDTDGKFRSVAVIPSTIDDDQDAAYFVVERILNGTTVYCIEKLHTRTFDDVRDAFFVDCGLSLDNPITISGVSLANPGVITATAHGLSNGDTVDISDIVWEPTEDAYGNMVQPDQLNDTRYLVANATANTFTLTATTGSGEIDHPTTAAPTEFSNNTAALSHSVTMPATVAAGGLLVMIAGVLNASGTTIPTITTPTGWTLVGSTTQSTSIGGVTAIKTSTFVKDAAGTEGGTTVALVTDVATKAIAHTYYVAPDEWSGTAGDIEAASANNGATTTPNPPALTPSGGEKDYLWLTACFCGDDALTVTAAPASYTGLADTTIGGANSGCEMGSAKQALTASSENPGTFTLSGSDASLAVTIAIPPPAAAGIDTSAFSAYVEGGEVREAVLSISGLSHLANEPVAILANGIVVDDKTVSASGTITLDTRASRVHIGLPYVADVETLNPELQASNLPTIQGKPKKNSKVVLRFNKSKGVWVGPNSENLYDRTDPNYWGISDDPLDLISTDREIILPPDWNSNGRIFIRQRDPLPITILMVLLDSEIGDL